MSARIIKNILLVRTDRIGDVVLSLPMLPELKRKYPAAKITVMVRSYTKDLVAHHSCVDDVILWEEGKTAAEYVRLLEQRSFDMAIIPYPRFELAWIMFRAGIPVRVGTGYRWYSFLFNKRTYEHRKDAQKHEAEYNINLLRSIGITPSERLRFEFAVTPAVQQRVDRRLFTLHLEKFVVLHAGSGGSARDWSIANFARLGEALHKELGYTIVLTGGANEKDLVASLAQQMAVNAENLCGEFSIEELAALFQRAALFVSNSTGPLHIAAMMGTPVAAFYPPIRQCSAVRWGPYTEKKAVFTADNAKCTLCQGGECRSNICMDQITVEQVMDSVKQLIPHA